jgi:hypothetical protein
MSYRKHNHGITGIMHGKQSTWRVEASCGLLLLVSDPKATLMFGDLQIGAARGDAITHAVGGECQWRTLHRIA